MPGPKPELIELTPTQESILERLVRREKSSQQLVRRSHIILAANQGTANEQIAQHQQRTKSDPPLDKPQYREIGVDSRAAHEASDSHYSKQMERASHVTMQKKDG